MDVLIVGAGPTGLTLAIELQRRGVPHRIIEAAEHPFEGSRGKGLQPRTLEVLDDLGVLDDFLATGGEYPPLLIHRDGEDDLSMRLDERHEPRPDVPHPNGLMVPQWRTGELLAARYAALGGTISYGTALTDFSDLSGEIRASFGTGESVSTRYLVGADGGRSTVRHKLGVGFEGTTHPEQTLTIADVRLTGLSRDAWHIWAGADGRTQRLTLCPLAGTDTWQLTTPQAGDVREIVAAIAPHVTIEHVGWTSRWRANIRMVDRFRSGNAFLAGDAAHVHSPAGGQGLNTGIQDAYNLGWKLATGDDALLDTYEAERLPVAAHVLGISTRLHRNHLTARPEDAMRRDDPVLRQLSLTYRGGPLALDTRPAPGALRAGDRAPDAPCSPMSVHAALRGPHWTLLAFDAPPVDLGPGVVTVPVLRPGSPPAEGSLVDTFGHARDAYDVGEKSTYFLVRPDNYLGCVTHDAADLTTYLRTPLPTAA